LKLAGEGLGAGKNFPPAGSFKGQSLKLAGLFAPPEICAARYVHGHPRPLRGLTRPYHMRPAPTLGSTAGALAALFWGLFWHNDPGGELADVLDRCERARLHKSERWYHRTVRSHTAAKEMPPTPAICFLTSAMVVLAPD
jgi:hypothetical protein